MSWWFLGRESLLLFRATQRNAWCQQKQDRERVLFSWWCGWEGRLCFFRATPAGTLRVLPLPLPVPSYRTDHNMFGVCIGILSASYRGTSFSRMLPKQHTVWQLLLRVWGLPLRQQKVHHPSRCEVTGYDAGVCDVSDWEILRKKTNRVGPDVYRNNGPNCRILPNTTVRYQVPLSRSPQHSFLEPAHYGCESQCIITTPVRLRDLPPMSAPGRSYCRT